MSKPVSKIAFRFMAFFIRCRDIFSPPHKELERLGIDFEGNQLLDYGCGPGGYSIAAAKIVGKNGKVHAADIHPLAIKYVKQKAKKSNITNIDFIQTDCETGLSNNSIDRIMFYDILHLINNHERNLQEFHRILKKNGTLIVSNHHMKEKEILQAITTNNLFKLAFNVNKTYIFEKS
ncbi:MAG: class I SAM-dependent methyltransferase [Asgard group archaeon]|nr:class I SAM-dependent methyltransferase [Asgard group archaeon]